MIRFTLALALALPACATMPSTAPPATSVTLTGARAFAAAELAYITAARGVGIAVDAGLVTGATATTVRGYNAEARKLLVDGKATTDAARQAAAAAELFGIVANLDAVKGVRP